MSVYHEPQSVSDMVSKDAPKEVREADKKRQEDLKSDIKRATTVYHNLSEAEQTRLRKLDKYQADHVYCESFVTRSLHQVKEGLKAVHRAIESNFRRDAYRKYRPMIQSDNDEVRKLTLHHSRGTELQDQGYQVISINIGGSSFDEFRREQSGFKGKGNEEKTESDRNRFQKVYGKRVWKWLGTFFPPMLLEKERKVQGKPTSVKYTLSGPAVGHGKLKGLFDIGQYKMDHLQTYIVELGKERLMPIFQSWKKGVDPKEVYFVIQGHSRGAAALSVGAKNLVEWAKKAYPNTDYWKYIRVECVQRDPVPGPDNIRDTFKKVDLRDTGGAVSATTIYSMHTEYSHFFTPQWVRGQKNIILTADKHSVGQDMVDGSQMAKGLDKKYRQEAFVDATGLHAYRGSGLTQLPEGVYFRDEHNALVRARSYKEAAKALRAVREDASGQEKREKVILEVMKNWFIDNEYVDPDETEAEMKTAFAQAMIVLPSVYTAMEQLPAWPEMANLRTLADPLADLLTKPFTKQNIAEIFRHLNASISACRAVMEKLPEGRTLQETTWIEIKMENASQVLSAFRSMKAHLKKMMDQDFTALQTQYRDFNGYLRQKSD